MQNRLTQAIRYGLLASACAAISLPVVAQQEGPVEEETAELERVQVTGSRLARAEFIAPAPVTTVTAEEISQSGFVTLGDILSEMPQFSTTFTSQNSSRFIGTAGGGFLNLRGLGTARTLVLINGRRHVGASVGSQRVDINSIPSDLIDRIEVSTGAQSAVYGSDAVAGTVNVILKNDFEGVLVRGSAGFAERASSDFHRYSTGITVGSNFANQRGNSVTSISYDQQDLLTAEQSGGRFLLQQGFINNPDAGSSDPNDPNFDPVTPIRIFVPNRGNFSFSNGGTTFSFDPTFQSPAVFDPDGTLRFLDRENFEFIEGVTQCGGANCEPLDLRSFVPLQTGFERFTFDNLTTFKFNSNLEGYLEVRYSNVDAEQQGQPSFAPAGSVPTLPIFIDNPFLTDQARGVMADAGLGAIGLRRFNVDLGLREEFDNRETVRGVGGLRGSFTAANRVFDFDLYANYGRTSLERINGNNLVPNNFLAAIDAVRLTEADLLALEDNEDANPGALPFDAGAGSIICRSQLQAAQGENPVLANGNGVTDFIIDNCQPLDILGEGRASEAALAFVNSTAVGTGLVEQVQTGFDIGSSELFDPWGAGPIGALIGVEYREESTSSVEDSLSGQSATFFNALGATSGSFDVKEVFAETIIPLLRDKPFAQNLSIEGAGRISDYSTIGTTETWEVRLNWQPFEQLTFRGTIGESIRAPTIGDLFSPQSQSFANFADPCDKDQLEFGREGRDVRIANCRALGIADPESFVADDDSSFELLVGGNPNLREEEADVWTAGFVWTPTFIRNLDIAIDMWDIEVTQAIAATGAATIAQRCVDDTQGINNQFCALVTRGADGNIDLIEQFSLNLNEFKTQGVDLSASYRYQTDTFGLFSFRSNVQWLRQRKFILNTADDVDFDAGELGDPRVQANFNVNWAMDRLGAFSQIRVIDEQLIIDRSTLRETPNAQDITKVGAEIFVDLGITYDFPKGFAARFTVDNVFDNVCPKVLGTCTGGGSAIFDNVGRFYNLGLSWRL